MFPICWKNRYKNKWSLGRVLGSVVDSVKCFRQLDRWGLKPFVNQKVVGDLSGNNSHKLLRHLVKCANLYNDPPRKSLLSSPFYRWQSILATLNFSRTEARMKRIERWTGIKDVETILLWLAACLNILVSMREINSTGQRQNLSTNVIKKKGIIEAKGVIKI